MRLRKHEVVKSMTMIAEVLNSIVGEDRARGRTDVTCI